MKEKSVIVIPFNLPWEWSTDYTNQTAYILSRKNIVICYMWAESFSLKEYITQKKLPRFVKKYRRNIYLFYPLFLVPGRRFKQVHFLNERLNVLFLKFFAFILCAKNKISQRIVWIFDPNNRFIVDLLGKGWKVIYDCVDYFIGAVPENKKEITRKNEARLVREADLVVANSTVLQKHLLAYKQEVPLVPQGFRVQDFQKKVYKSPKISLPHPIIGFAGAVNYRIDYDLLLPLAETNPKWSFVVWGPVLEKEKVDAQTWKKMQKLLSLPNVASGFLKDRKKLPGVFRQFDIAMIPYDTSHDFNKYCYPMKLFEFFYLGLPVVSTEVEELKRFPDLVKIGKNYEEWEKIIKKLLSKPWPKKLKKMGLKLAKENSWENKVFFIQQALRQSEK